eukprot:6097283-Amphidinium_carterae.1
MAPVMQTQKLIPASVLHLVSSSLIWLIKLHEDLMQPPLIRQWSFRILVLAPRLLWPAPPKPAEGARLPPFARPHLIKHRLHLLHSGQWRTLLDTVLEVPLWRPAKDVAANPGTVTPAAAKRIAAAAKEGKIGTAWKQLWSYGVATPTAHTAEAVERKWAPQAEYPLPSPLPLASPDSVNNVLTPNRWKHALRKLKRGRAADAVGWTAEAFLALTHSAELGQLLQRIMLYMLTGALPPEMLKLMSASSLVALRKDAQTGVRPIAVPAIWRKIASSMVVKHFKEVATTHMGNRQFGIYVANGSAAFATKVSELAEASPHSLLIQCDMANAFGSVHRHALQQAMQKCSVDLSHMTRSWLAHESTGYLLRDDGRRHKVLLHSKALPN